MTAIVEKWIAGSGVGLTWTAIYNTNALNALTDGQALLSNNIDNSSALDEYMDLSINFVSKAWANSAHIKFYLYPLNQDGSTYGDGRFSSALAGPPDEWYFVGNLANYTGTHTGFGVLSGITMPPGQFKIVTHNLSGVTWANGDQIYYRTYNRQII